MDISPSSSSGGGEMLPLRVFNMAYEPFQLEDSGSPTSTSAASPLPDVSNALAQYQNEILGGPPVHLTWKSLRVLSSLPASKNSSPIRILDDITGFAEPFRMLAILGAPSSGKSVLLQTLAGRLSRSATMEGEILVNGRRQQLTYGTSAYITPKDVFMETLTIRENMYFSALLKLPSTMPMKQKMDLVDQIILDMGLKNCTSTNVGNLHSRGINKGERRRLSLAMELLMRPRLLYLDDPIDGLNSSAALLYIAKLKVLAREGRTVIACIREPNNDLLRLFDYVLVLGGSKMVYFGEACSAVQNFPHVSLSNSLQKNPITSFLHVNSVDYREMKSTWQCLQDFEKANANEGDEGALYLVKNLVTSYQSSDVCARMTEKGEELSNKKGAVLVNLGSHAGTALQIAVLCYRSYLNSIRNLYHYWARLFFSAFIMAIVGTLFIGLNHSLNSIQERASCLFLILEISVFLMIGGMPYFFHEMAIFARERLNEHYSIMAFVIGISLSSLPLIFLTSIVSSCVVYFSVGLHPGFGHFMYLVLNLCACLHLIEGILMIISTFAHNYFFGAVLGTALQVMMMLVAGFLHRPIDIPKPVWTYPFSYLSFHPYALWGLYQNEFVGLHFGHGRNQQSGAHVIQHVYGMTCSGKWTNLVVLVLMALGYRVLYYLTVRCYGQLLYAFLLCKAKAKCFCIGIREKKDNANQC